MIDASQILGGWPLAAALALAVGTAALRTWRRRAALNEAIHELRRPLQAIALAPAFETGSAGAETPVQLAAAALERLEREVNGGAATLAREPFAMRPVVEAAIGRWRAGAGGSIELRWQAGDAAVVGDRVALAQALDNLIVNAIEHGGPEIRVECERREGRLVVTVADRRAGAHGANVHERVSAIGGTFSGERGHGLSVVRRTAAEHGGRFVLSRSEAGARAALELPVAGTARPAA